MQHALQGENNRLLSRKFKRGIAEMAQIPKLTAEKKFAAIQKKDKQVHTEMGTAQEEKIELTAKLRALRLAKEAADMKAAEKKTVRK